MTMSVWKNRYKPWVRQLVGPYVCTFSIACIVSAGTIAQKLKLVRERHQSRTAALRNGPLVLGGVAVPIELAQNEALKTLKEKFDQNQLATKKMYCSILLGLVEGAHVRASAFARWHVLSASSNCADAPMSALSLYYLIQSIQECTKSADENRSRPTMIVCDLPVNGGQIALLVISTVTSVGMLAAKACKIVPIRLRRKEKEMLEAERTRLLAELSPTPSDSPPNSGAVSTSAAAASVQVLPASIGVGAQIASADVTDGPPAPAGLDPEFAVAPVALSPAVASGTSRAPAPGAFRGECPACKKGVYTTDEGRVREGDSYYHEGCVKGACSKCGDNVYGDQARGHENGAYFHLECPH